MQFTISRDAELTDVLSPSAKTSSRPSRTPWRRCVPACRRGAHLPGQFCHGQPSTRPPDCPHGARRTRLAHERSPGAIQNARSAVVLKHQKRLSDLRDLDYTDAATRLMRQQTVTQAAQQSFAKVAKGCRCSTTWPERPGQLRRRRASDAAGVARFVHGTRHGRDGGCRVHHLRAFSPRRHSARGPSTEISASRRA